MRSYLSLGLLVAWSTTAVAAVHIDGTAITADGYTAVIDDDSTSVGASLQTSAGLTIASRLAVPDGDASCTTATRWCAVVVNLPEWILRQCDRAEQCTDTDTVATTWQSFWSEDLTMATWLQWQDAGAAPAAHSLLAAALPVPSAAQIIWWHDASEPSQSANADGWSVDPCAPPIALSLPTTGGTVHLAASWSGITPVACAASAGAELTLELARGTPVTSTDATLFAALEINENADAALVALDRLTTTPTENVAIGARWLLDDDDVIDGLGIAALTIDAEQQRLVWTVAPTNGRARQRLRYLVRGVLNGGRQLSAYLGSEPLENAVSQRLELAAARTFTDARLWQAWQAGDSVCVQGNQWCYEAASPFPFSGLELDIASGAVDLVGDWQYWNGSAWVSLTLTSGGGAANLAVSGAVRWQMPSDWQPSDTLVDGTALRLYAVRLRSNPGFSGAPASLNAASPDLLLFAPGVSVTEPVALRLTFNQRPIASTTAANIDLATDETARLDGGPSFDPDGTPLTYAWRQSSGPDAELTSASVVVASARLPKSGLYVFALVVSDGDLESAPAFVTVRAGTFADLDRGCDCGAAPPWTLALVILALRRRQGRTVK